MTTIQTTFASAWRSAFINRIWPPRRQPWLPRLESAADPAASSHEQLTSTALSTTSIRAGCTMCDGESVDAFYRRFTSQVNSLVDRPEIMLIDLRSVTEADTKLVGCLVAMLCQARARRIRLVFVLSEAVARWSQVHRLDALFVESAHSVAGC